MKKLFTLLTALVAFNAMAAFAGEDEVSTAEPTTEVVAVEAPAAAE